jgi:hypothetical protein
MIAMTALIGSLSNSLTPNAPLSGIVEQVSQTIISTTAASKSTAETKYGTTSILFNGTGAFEYYLASGFQSSSQSMTLEYWVYVSSSETNVWQAAVSNQSGGSGQSVNIGITNGGTIYFNLSDTAGASSNQANSTVNVNAWNHVVFWVSATNWSAWINGTIVSNNAGLASGSPNYQQIVTKYYLDMGGWPKFGTYSGGFYADDIRVSSGNRYNNTSFTPPTSRLTVDGTTLALIQAI